MRGGEPFKLCFLGAFSNSGDHLKQTRRIAHGPIVIQHTALLKNVKFIEFTAEPRDLGIVSGCPRIATTLVFSLDDILELWS